MTETAAGPISEEETRALLEQARHGDFRAREQLAAAHQRLIGSIVRRFLISGREREDLYQVGCIGLLKAIDRFDPDRGLEFTTFATPTIMGEIKRHFRDKGWSVRVPRRLQELSARVNQVTDDLTSELNRTPTVEEIAERLDTSVDEVLEAMESSSAYSSVPLEGGTTEDEDAPGIIDRFATEDADLISSDDRIVIEETLASFSPREQDAIRMRFVEGLTQVEIAEKLGISQVQVSRLLRRALKRVQERLEE